MSRLREQFKKIPAPRNNNFKNGGGVLSWLVDAAANVGEIIKSGAKTVTDIARDIIDATGGDKGLIGSMLKKAVDSGASEQDMNGIYAALMTQLGGKTDGGIDFSGLPAMEELQGFAGSGFKTVKAGAIGDSFKSRFPGESLVGGQNTNLSKLATQNTIFNPQQYMSYKIDGPRGTNIKVG